MRTDANGARSFGPDGARIRLNAGPTLNDLAANWTTPSATDDRRAGRLTPKMSGTTLAQQVNSTWPTPAARDWKGENGADHLQNGTGRLHMDQLPNAVAHGFTRPGLPTWIGGLASSVSRRTSRRLLRSATSSVPQTKLRQWLKRGWWRRRRLNPCFVEWLMAWPPGHALCGCSETAFTLWQRDTRGALSRLPTASGPWIWKPPAEAAPEPKQMEMF